VANGREEHMMGRAVLQDRSLAAMARAGVLPLGRPHHLLRMAGAMRTYAPFGGSVRVAAIRHHDLPAIADERGEISYGDQDENVVRLANALRAAYPAGATLGILCRNHRGPLAPARAASRAGLNTVWLNTAFSARQMAEVATCTGFGPLDPDHVSSEVGQDHASVRTGPNPRQLDDAQADQRSWHKNSSS
jgi:fatty-acyl-CoA synthase